MTGERDGLDLMAASETPPARPAETAAPSPPAGDPGLGPPPPAPAASHAALGLLHYRPWRGDLRRPACSVGPIARVCVTLLFRRKLFWVLYALALFFFLIFFFGQYLLAWAESQIGEQAIPLGMGIRGDRDTVIQALRTSMRLDGSGYTYRTFIWWQGHMVMVVLALAGAVLVGNDFRFGSLPFYLSKPLDRRHYVLGKCLAVAVFVNLMTTLPAVVLFVQYGLLTSYDYFLDRWHLLAGILGYGLLLTVCLSVLLVATASWLRRTVPLIMAWTTLFVFLRFLVAALVDGLHYDARWRLIDLWNNMYLVGNALLGMAPETVRPSAQPDVLEAVAILAAMCLVCVGYLLMRIRAVEIVK
jgi:ABC-type transport system involved in multi-copper enzyme maturation permease subunit